MSREYKQDADLLNSIISQICNYSVENGMSPNESLKMIAQSILELLKIATFDNWKVNE